MEEVIMYVLGGLTLAVLIGFIRFELWYHDHRKTKF